MSYLLDKKIKRKKFFNVALGVLVLIILFYFRLSIFNGFSYVTGGLFRPVFILGNNVGEKFTNLGSYFASKKSLSLENENLKTQIKESEADRANYASVVAENVSLKETLGRKNEKVNMILVAILAKPNQSLYDTLVIDAGTKQGIKTDSTVFALGNVPIGRVADIYPNSSKVILFSSPGEKTQAIISTPSFSPPKGETSMPSPLGRVREGSGGDIFMELVGRGGGNFEMILPRDLTMQKGDQVVLPGISPYVLAIAETIISDPRDPFTKALLRSPVNIQELKFVEVEE